MLKSLFNRAFRMATSTAYRKSWTQDPGLGVETHTWDPGSRTLQLGLFSWDPASGTHMTRDLGPFTWDRDPGPYCVTELCLQHYCFPVEFAKFLRIPILKKISKQLLL